ncbi:MAG TPA: carbamate kinase [Candidatus Dormibacteraeota bacterium]|jgi:carbamate kinase|nr:carbamate kinase [Candidatus Dormibacteraeota bacterium]
MAGAQGAVTPTAVVALGGNALAPEGESPSFERQEAQATRMARAILDLIDAGYRLVLTHGNGPQVGMLALQQQEAAHLVPPQPLFVLGAMTQGQLGSLVAVALRNLRPDRPPPVVAVVSHVLVDAGDPAFQRPTKPVGPFLDRAQAQRLGAERGWQVAEDAGRGYRRVVPSPEPLDLVEADAIGSLLQAGFVVIAAGGGGIPVVRRDRRLVGAEAVIDKDLAAQRLASSVGARTLIMITAVDQVQVDYGTPRARPLREISAEEAEAYLAEGQFPAGSMGPKVDAAVRFLAAGGELAIITSPDHILEALRGEHGTRIVSSGAARTRSMRPR